MREWQSRGSEEWKENGELGLGFRSGFRRENEAGAIASFSDHRCGEETAHALGSHSLGVDERRRFTWAGLG